ncbi:hypothetical protein KF913_16560 [Candidatus Obscuribacterales bacterium]|nr:hypothetical protein [Candidatus Obscuribacterales bacterium]
MTNPPRMAGVSDNRGMVGQQVAVSFKTTAGKKPEGIYQPDRNEERAALPSDSDR